MFHYCKKKIRAANNNDKSSQRNEAQRNRYKSRRHIWRTLQLKVSKCGSKVENCIQIQIQEQIQVESVKGTPPQCRHVVIKSSDIDVAVVAAS